MSTLSIRIGALTAALAFVPAILGAQGSGVTMSNPRPKPVVQPTVAVPTGAALTPAPSTTGILHTGPYQLRLQAPAQATGAQVTTVSDVNVVVAGTAVHITAGSSAETLDGTIAGSQVQIHGVAGGANVTLSGAQTPSGVSGTLALQDSTGTVHGTFALTVVHAAQLRKIDPYGTKPAAAPGKTWSQIWQEIKCALGLC